MKTSLSTAAFVLSLASLIPASTPPAARGHDLVDTAVAAGFKTLATALEKADLVDALRGDGPFTVFAPTDEAFAKLPKKTLQALLRPENRAQLRAILTFHVVPGRVAAKDVVNLRFATTLNGQRAAIEVADGKVRIGGARVLKTDVTASNGIIHVIDRVILPQTDDLARVAKASGQFETLIQAVTAAGLAKPLMGEGPFTVLAPNDAAFAKIPAKTLGSLLEKRNLPKLAEILKLHVIPGRVYADQALAAGSAKTLNGQSVRFRLDGGQLRVGAATVLDNDLAATNGVIHVIDTVLMPAKPRGRKLLGLSYSQPGAALAAQLELDRHKTLVVTAVTADGNAKAAGLRKFDVITEVDGRPATDGNVTRAKKERDYGDAVEIRVLRRGEPLVVRVPIGAAAH